MKIVDKTEGKIKCKIKWRTYDCYGYPSYKTKTVYIDDIPIDGHGNIKSDEIRKYAAFVVKNQQFNTEQFIPVSTQLEINGIDGKFISAV